MARYRKKPVEVQAYKVDGSRSADLNALAKWCNGSASYLDEWDSSTAFIHIPTLEGVMKANHGDYIIKGVQGEFYPCKPDIFEATYERV